MNRMVASVALFIGLLAGSPGPTVAATDTAALDAGAQLAGIERSLRAIAENMERILDYQRAELLLRRAELVHQRLGPREQEARASRDSLRQIESEVALLEEMRKSFERDLNEELKTGLTADDSEARRNLEQLEIALKSAEDTKTSLERTLEELDLEMAEQRRQAQWLDRLLGDLFEELAEDDIGGDR